MKIALFPSLLLVLVVVGFEFEGNVEKIMELENVKRDIPAVPIPSGLSPENLPSSSSPNSFSGTPSRRSSSGSSSSVSSSKRQNRGDRPQLTNNRVLPLTSTITGDTYEYLLSFLEFDQEVYVNEPFVCSGQDEPCVQSPCEACDWSVAEPDCSNPNCCGPHQFPHLPSINHTQDYCNSSLPPYTKLEFNEYSEKFTLYEGEYKYFRFFVGEEHYCRTIQVSVHSDYGQSSIAMSKLIAYPNATTINSIENGQIFTATNQVRRNPLANFGQSTLNICPNVMPAYERGTYTIAVAGLSVKTIASIVVHLGEEYPIEPDDDRISCADVPASEYRGSVYGYFGSAPGGSFCVEEGVTTYYETITSGLWYEIIMPVREGCHEIQFITNGYTNQGVLTDDGDTSDPGDTAQLIFCMQTSELSMGSNTGSAMFGRTRGHDDMIYFAGCFDEPTYVHCYTYSYDKTGTGMYYWTTNSEESPPLRYKMSEVSPGYLSVILSMGAAGGFHPDLNYEGLFNWGLNGYSWLSQPQNDPLVFWPPYEENVFNFSTNPLDVYRDALAEVNDNLVVVADLLVRKNTQLRSKEMMLEGGFLALFTITSATGMPVELCDGNGCNRGDPVVEFGSFTDFIPTITYSSLNVVEDFSSLCHEKDYYAALDLVVEEQKGALGSSDLDFVAQKLFVTDLFNAGLAHSTCVKAMETQLQTRMDNVTTLQENYCPWVPLSDDWNLDPCCNSRAKSNACCATQSLFVEDELYTEAEEDDVQDFCKHSDCDESFFTDIATSLNAAGNPLIGCASGLGNPLYELDVVIEREMENFIRPCLVKAGYGEIFQGVDCVKDEDCQAVSTTCDRKEGKCRRFSAQQTRKNYFDCFVDEMSPTVEDYIRRAVIPASIDKVAEAPKDSKLFYDALWAEALQMDCINSWDALDIYYSERWIADNALACKGEGVFLQQNYALMESQETYINSVCPMRHCLGERTCRYENAKQCKQQSIDCADTYHVYLPPNEEDCPVDETVCNVEGSDCSVRDGECVVCMNEDEAGSCTPVPGVTSEAVCDSLVPCEMPDGTLRFDLTAQQCEDTTGSCTSDCDGQQCRSVRGLSGTCQVVGVDAAICGSFSGAFVGTECIVTYMENAYQCGAFGAQYGLTTEWRACERMDLDTCANNTLFDGAYLYLSCFVDTEFRSCDTRQECEASGTCSDIEITRNVRQDGLGWFSVSYGTCLSSGLSGIYQKIEPDCWNVAYEFQFRYGCYFPGIDASLCYWWGSDISPLFPHWTAWVTPAKTEAECHQPTQGRYGCAIPKDFEKTYWFWNESACDCYQGTGEYLYSWTPGSWEGGKVHSTSWITERPSQKYQWEEAISLVRMEQWVQEAMENSFVYALKSQLVCETNYVTSSLSTLVCDCVGDGEGQNGESCYRSDIETQVGITGACAEAESVLKGPSSFTTFRPDSITERCTEVTLSLIQRSWFLFPKSTTAVSFQFAERPDPGIVVNRKGATVGTVMGDGSKIDFTHRRYVDYFVTCLLISEDYDGDKYKVRDFGIPSDDLSQIYPIGVSGIYTETVELFDYWCATIKKKQLDEDDGSITLFPVYRLEDYEDETEDSLSHQTESLIYTLAACYLLDLVLVVLYVGCMIHKYTLAGKDMPVVTWLGVIFAIVCIFRIVFCFVYIDDGFSELAEYVMFEIPTFLLFTGVILVIGLFVRLSKKNTFDFRSQDKQIWLFGSLALICVWSLFIVVTVVYAVVILETETESECPGRVQASNDEIEEDTRTLSIVYQTIVIFLTLLFALAFGYKAYKLFGMTKRGASNAKKFIFRLGIVIVSAFLLRCILFLILLAVDFTSDIYLFITLFLTEVLMILLIALELNKGFYFGVLSNVTSAASTRGTFASRQSSGPSDGSRVETTKSSKS